MPDRRACFPCPSSSNTWDVSSWVISLSLAGPEHPEGPQHHRSCPPRNYFQLLRESKSSDGNVRRPFCRLCLERIGAPRGVMPVTHSDDHRQMPKTWNSFGDQSIAREAFLERT